MNGCKYSKLTIPCDMSYIDVVVAYVRQVAETFGFDEQARDDLSIGVRETISKIIRQTFDPAEKTTLDISCERVPLGLRIIIRDKGLPLDPAEIVSTESDPSSPSPLMDEVSFHNLGPEGQETHLIKYLRNRSIQDYHEACDVASIEEIAKAQRPSVKKLEFDVRPMRPEEAVEASKCFYKAYGYSFVYRHIYYPDRIIELNKSGEMKSVVGVTKDGEVIGHCALLTWDEGSTMAEIGLAVVKPEFRRQGCLSKMTEYLVQMAKLERLQGLFVFAATNHTFSQQVIHRFGFDDCGLLVGFGPATVTFKGLTESLPQRESYLICYRHLEKPQTCPLYAPGHHKDFIRQLYRNIGFESQFEVPADPAPHFYAPSTILQTSHYSPSGFGSIEIEAYGSDILRQVKAGLRDLCLKHVEVIQLHCDLSNPLTYHLTTEFERLGFFFGGIWPGSSCGDVLILQYLNNVMIDYNKIKTVSLMGNELRSYIEQHDPNQAWQ